MHQIYLCLEHYNQLAVLFCLTLKHQSKEDKWFQYQVQSQEIPQQMFYRPIEGQIFWQIRLQKIIQAEL